MTGGPSGSTSAKPCGHSISREYEDDGRKDCGRYEKGENFVNDVVRRSNDWLAFNALGVHCEPSEVRRRPERTLPSKPTPLCTVADIAPKRLLETASPSERMGMFPAWPLETARGPIRTVRLQVAISK